MKTELPHWANTTLLTSSSTAKSSAIVILSGVARLVASFLGALVLARFLTPGDFGLVALATPIILLAGAFADGGVSTYTLQSKSTSSKELTLAFWLALFSGIAVFIFLLAISPLVALLFNEEDLTLILVALAFSVLFSVVGSQHNAISKKYHRQQLYALAEITAALMSFLGALGVAYVGGGYWALVAIPLVRQLVHTIVIWLVTGWVPSRPSINVSSSKIILGFSVYIIIFQIINILNKSIDKWFLGYNQGVEELGLYAMAVSIMMLPSMQLLSPIGGAVIPLFSSVFHNAIEDLGDMVYRVSFVLIIIICPLMVWAATYSGELIVLVLGSAWQDVAPIFSILAYASIAMSFLSVVGWLYTSMGRAKTLSYLSGFSFVLFTISVGVASVYGSITLAWTVVLNFIFMIITYLIFISREKEIDIPILKILLHCCAVILISYFFSEVVRYVFDRYVLVPFVEVLFSLLVYLIICWGTFFLMFPNVRRVLKSFNGLGGHS